MVGGEHRHARLAEQRQQREALLADRAAYIGEVDGAVEDQSLLVVPFDAAGERLDVQVGGPEGAQGAGHDDAGPEADDQPARSAGGPAHPEPGGVRDGEQLP